MTLFNQYQRATLSQQNLQLGSPLYTYKVASIPASGRVDYDFATDIEVWINQDPNNVIYSPSGTIIKSTDYPIRSLRIVNQNSSTATTNNAIQLSLQKLPADTNTFIRKIFKVIGV